MKIFEWLADLRYRNPLLYRVGMVHLILGFLLFVPLMVDSREVMGINTWVKPIKFSFSIAIYAWTFGWILFDLPNSKKWIKGISWTVAVSMVIEIAVILFQAARATQSHFNEGALLDGILFGIMGLFIAVNTITIFITFILFVVKKPNLDKTYVLALRLAFVVFIIGNWVGGQMIKNKAHSVGVADGGEGLPFVNWSTLGGDLRVAHFLGLHAIQLIPLFAFFLYKKTGLSPNVRYVLSALFAVAYGGLVSYLYMQAADGVPLIAS